MCYFKPSIFKTLPKNPRNSNKNVMKVFEENKNCLKMMDEFSQSELTKNLCFETKFKKKILHSTSKKLTFF